MNPIHLSESGGHTRSSAPQRMALASGIASIAMLAAAGCQSVGFKVSKDTRKTAEKSVAAELGSGSKTDFHGDATNEQGFNVHVELARVYESQGNNEAAVAEYQKAADLAAKKGSVAGGPKLEMSQVATAERRMGAALDRMGRFTQAEVHYRKALGVNPKDARVWNDVGYSYYLQNRYADAERSLKMAESLEPNNPRVQTNLGLTLAADGKIDKALDALSRAGGPAVAHANLGFILAAVGKNQDAKLHYETALTLQPDLTAAREALAKIDARASSAPTALASAVSAIPTPANASGVGRPDAPRDSVTAPASVTTPAPAPSRPTTIPPPIPRPMTSVAPRASRSTVATIHPRDAAVARTSATLAPRPRPSSLATIPVVGKKAVPSAPSVTKTVPKPRPPIGPPIQREPVHSDPLSNTTPKTPW